MIRIPAPHARKKARIEIVPLIDIVFFLLATFVMVSLSMVQNQGIMVKLPQARTGAAIDRTAPVMLTVTREGGYLINKERVAPEQIRSEFERLRRLDPEISVIISGDDAADFGAAVRALDEVRQAGVVKVAIQTRKSRG